jgi:polar amino acid transport system substrate-binding protein
MAEPGKRCRGYAALAQIWVVAALPSGADAQTAPPAPVPRRIEYAYPDQSVWTTAVDEGGEIRNPLLRLAASLFASAGIPWNGKSYPAARMFEYLQDGTADFSILVNTPALRKCCVISKNPVASTELRIYRMAGTPPVERQEDLIGKDIITILGYGYGGLQGFIADKGNRIYNNVAMTHESAFIMLERGRADYLLEYVGPATEILSIHPIPALRADVFGRLYVHMVLSKAYPDAENVMVRLEAIAEKLKKDDVLQTPAR